MRAYLNYLLAIFSLLTMGIYAQEPLSEQCAYDIFPVFIGGVNGGEKTSCFLYDARNDVILIGGNTTSDDFAPASNEHGFLMAIDTSGNYKWGKFFYNVSYALSDLQGCQMSSGGSSLTIVGLGNSQPVIMSVSPATGEIERFLSIEYKDRTDDNVPEYDVAGAIYNEERNRLDGNNYFYTAFLMNDTMQMMRIENSNSPSIDWNLEVVDLTTDQQTDDFYRRKEPNFIHEDPDDDQVLYLTGRLQGSGALIRFAKTDGGLRWWAKFELLSNIYAFAYGTDDSLFICGDYQPNEKADSAVPDTAPYDAAEFKAGFARLDNDGEIRWFYQMGGTNPLSGTTGVVDQDRCRGISYNQVDDIVSVLIQSKAQQLRDNWAADHYDTVLITMEKSGTVKDAVTISQGSLQYDMYSSAQGLFHIGEDYYFTGWAYGFLTTYQELQADSVNPKYDAYVYRYQFGRDAYTCLRREELTKAEVDRRLTRFDDDEVYDLRKRGSELFATVRRKDYFYPYVSSYSGGFDLMDSFRIPRPCAFRSQNLTSAEYYRGQRAKTYDIFGENSANSLTLMGDNARIQYQTGESSADLAVLDLRKNTVLIQTDEEEKVGVQKVLIRDCDFNNRLLEANLYIEVLSNNYPDFETEPTTTWVMAVDDVVTYRLPNVVDPEGNDEPEVYVDIMDAQEDKYPPFLMFENATNTLIFKPASKWVSGRQYYFTIVVKEKNSDSVKYSFYCTVRITGDQYFEDTNPQNITINYNLTTIDDQGRGAMVFDADVNMEFLEEEFGNLFSVYWTDTEYKQNKEKRQLKDFVVTDWGTLDNRTIAFNLTFEKPYRIGLLLKRSDKLVIARAEGADFSGMYLTNATITNLATEDAQQRLEMLFDWENPEMALMRNIAKNMYWVMVGLILLQFVLLTVRRVGLLPVWVFIEYLQLVGFMPIYNFRLIPYLYDAFKPSLVSHMIIFDETPGFEDTLDKEYFNDNYKNYWLSVGRLFQSFFFVVLFLICILISHLVVFLIYKTSRANPTLNAWAKRKLIQFKFNAYIRFYMLAYFDTTFFSIMKINEPNNSTTWRKAALLTSYVVFVLAIIIPVFLIAHVNRRFEILSLKEAKQSFNTLLLKIDKGSRWRVMNPAYFFARRFLTAILLTLPIENTFIFLQYVFILMSSHAYILYMVACKPYQTPSINSYVLANETFYSALIIAIFIFSDATPEQEIKYGAGVALMVSLVLLVVCNIIMNIVYLIQGPNTIKKAIKEANLKRAEKEALERAEEEERKLKKKKEEEEFTKIPDDTMNLSGVDPANSTNQLGNNGSDVGTKKKGKGKKKGNEDNVVEPNGQSSDDFQKEKGEKKRRKKAGQKGQDDNLESLPKSKSRKKTKDGQDTLVTGAHPTTQGNFLND